MKTFTTKEIVEFIAKKQLEMDELGKEICREYAIYENKLLLKKQKDLKPFKKYDKILLQKSKIHDRCWTNIDRFKTRRNRKLEALKKKYPYCFRRYHI